MFDIVIDRVSFWIGVAAGMVLAALWKRLAPVLGNIRAGIGARMQSLQAGLSTSIEKRYRLDIVRMAQDNHLAAALFSLDEIAIPPRLMAPPVPVIPGEDPPPADVYSMTIPYMPDWPELAACYNAPTLGFKDALAGGANLMVMGKPGSGKTFALNYFAAQVARRDPELDELGDLVPVLVHAADIVLPAKENKLTDVFYGAMNEKVSTLVEAKLSSFLNAIFEQELALLIVDGMDEMTQEGQTPIMEFLAEVAEKYPKNRMIVAASMENLPDHEGLGLTAIGLAGWTLRESSKFLSKWGELWDEFVVEESWARNLPEGIDRILLNGWLAKDIGASNPLDLTLKVWAAYAGDTLGASSEDNLEAFVRRMTGDVENSRLAIEQLAAQMVATLSPVLPRNQAGKFVAQFEDPEAPSDLDPEYIKSLEQMDDIEEGEEEELEVEKKKRGKGFSARKVRRMLPEMVKSNILTYRTSAKIGFMHPVICGYLAGCGLAEKGNPLEILSQPNWEGKNNALKYMVPKRDMTPVANTLLERQRHDAVRKDLFAIAKWPNHGAYGAPWKIHVMRELATLIRDNGYSLGLRGRAIAALASSGDENVSTLFRQLLISQHAEVRHLGALGCGLVQDEKAVRDLGSLLYDVAPSVRRAACLALVAIGTEGSIEMVATALLQGEEDVRRAAAEALSQYPETGYPILSEGSTLEDLLVRRAVVYGLSRIKEAWATAILEKMRLEDSQWVVRTAAQETLEAMLRPDPFTPKTQPPLHKTPWLIEFASEQGKGIAPGEASWKMLQEALKEGNEDQQLAAMDRYRNSPKAGKSMVPEMYKTLYGSSGDLREAAFNAIWQITATGVPLDSPTQFGLG